MIQYDFTGKFVLLQESNLLKEKNLRVFLVLGGNGAVSGRIGTGVFGMYLIDGEQCKTHIGSVERALDLTNEQDVNLLEESFRIHMDVRSGKRKQCPICNQYLFRINDVVVCFPEIVENSDTRLFDGKDWIPVKNLPHYNLSFMNKKQFDDLKERVEQDLNHEIKDDRIWSIPTMRYRYFKHLEGRGHSFDKIKDAWTKIGNVMSDKVMQSGFPDWKPGFTTLEVKTRDLLEAEDMNDFLESIGVTTNRG